MENTDEMNIKIEKKNTSVFSNGMKYGLYTGVASILLSLLWFALDVSRQSPLQYLSWIIIIGGIILGTINYRDKINGGFISFGNAFLTGFFVSLATGVLTAIFAYIFMNYIDPNAVQEILDETEQAMVDKGLDDQMIDQSMAMTKKMMTPGIMAGSAILGTLIIGSIISLITAAILKKNDDSFNTTFNS